MGDRINTGYSEIDRFVIPLTFPPGAQEEVFVGQREVATITLSADIVCLDHEPDICGPFPNSSVLLSGKQHNIKS